MRSMFVARMLGMGIVNVSQRVGAYLTCVNGVRSMPVFILFTKSFETYRGMCTASSDTTGHFPLSL